MDRQSAKVFVKLDVTPQAFFRLHVRARVLA